MKTSTMVFAISLLFISTASSAYDEYDYDSSSSDDAGYITSDDSYYNNSAVSKRHHYYYEPSFRRSYDNYAQKRFSGPGKTFIFDPKGLRWYAYYNGNLVNTGRASGGRRYCPDVGRPCRTPVGVFRIGHMGGPDCKSRKYPVGRGNAPMPWCMFFHRGFAIHGSWEVPNYNASHGCIRVPPPDAQWLSHYFMSPGTTVIVRGYH